MRVDALNSRATLVQTDVSLHELGVGEALREAAAEPDRLVVVDPASGRRLTYVEPPPQSQCVAHGLPSACPHLLPRQEGVSMAREIDLRTARADALFTSNLSARCYHSEAQVAAAIRRAIRSHGGVGGCAGAVAAAYGEHPETAAPRMRWARAAAERISSSAATSPVADRQSWRHVPVDGGARR
jgi:hypothetical protein